MDHSSKERIHGTAHQEEHINSHHPRNVLTIQGLMSIDPFPLQFHQNVVKLGRALRPNLILM